MKGVLITEPGCATIEEMEIPVPKDGEVLIRAKVAGMCGSDLNIFNGVHPIRKPPVMPGHEVAGEVISIGKNVKRISIGDRVTVLPISSYGSCLACRSNNINLCKNKIAPGFGGWEGTFAQYFKAPEECLYKIRPETTYEQAVMTEPLAVAVHSVKRAGNGKRMIILGCGTIGLLILKVALIKGYTEVYCTDTIAFNRKISVEAGASASWDPITDDINAKIEKTVEGDGVDAVMVTAAVLGILEQALSFSAIHANVVLIAIMNKPQAIDLAPFAAKEVSLTGTNTYMHEDFTEALSLIENGLDLSAIVTHYMPLDEAQHAFELYKNKTEDVIKILIYPN